MNSAGRLNVLRGIWRRARAEHIERRAALLVMAGYALEKLGRLGYRIGGFAPGRIGLFQVPVDILTEDDLVARCMTCAQQGSRLLVTHLTARTLLHSLRDPQVRTTLGQFDICYPEDTGVVLATALCRRRRARKVTVNRFYRTLFQEIANRGLRVALVGGEDGVCARVAAHLRDICPGLEVCPCRRGCGDDRDTAELTRALHEARPHIVILALGQPRQEHLALRLSRELTATVFWCVDGLFDRISGAAPAPAAATDENGIRAGLSLGR
jgi:N-acetylglucosaminyldiphosphoundecaprenol N-acetyl-beta-D-mannosaminyltransferase